MVFNVFYIYSKHVCIHTLPGLYFSCNPGTPPSAPKVACQNQTQLYFNDSERVIIAIKVHLFIHSYIVTYLHGDSCYVRKYFERTSHKYYMYSKL